MEENSDMEMPCSLKAVYESISFISLICSIYVIYATVKNIKMNLTNIFVIQIIISEILDEVNILLGIIADSKGKLNFENYPFRQYVCYTQIFLSVFSCLWTLTASLFISLKLYDLIINKGKIFRGKNFLNKNATFIGICAPFVLSYLLWTICMILDGSKINLYEMYDDKKVSNKRRVKLVFCWLNQETTIALACIVGLLIFANIYFSLIRGYFYLKKIKDNLIEEDLEINRSANQQLKYIDQVQKVLFLYPTISFIIYIIFFIFIFVYRFHYFERQNIAFSIFFCIIMSIRQIIYTLVFFLSQKKLRIFTKLFFTCKTCKKEKYKGKINQIKPLIEMKINDKEEDDDN